MNNLQLTLPAGVLGGSQAKQLFDHAQRNGYAIPAISVASYNIINSALESSAILNKPIIIQLYHGGCAFMAGRHLPNHDFQASIEGAINAAHFIHRMAEVYGVSVILQTDHCSKEQLPWLEALYKHSREYYFIHKKPLFTSHMLDFSLLPLRENIRLCKEYFKKFEEFDIFLEIELGVTGGVEDGVDNTQLAEQALYTNPTDVAYCVRELKSISENFIIAAAFGNKHGVYSGNEIKLRPSLLKEIQEYLLVHEIIEQPVQFVFHGGSGCTVDDIREAISYGVVKINFNTDVQWAAWAGIVKYYHLYEHYLQTQTGNSEGADKPNKNYYDPTVWLRKSEENVVSLIKEIFSYCNVT